MDRLKHDILLRAVKLINLVLITVPFALCWVNYYAPRTASRYYWKGNCLVTALFAILYFIYGRVYESFLVSLSRISEMIYSQLLAMLISDGILYVLAWLLIKRLPAVYPMLCVLAGQLLLSALWSVLVHRWYFKTFPAMKSAIIYDMRRGFDGLINEYGMDRKFDICVTASAEKCMDNLSILDGMEAVFLSGIHSHERNRILKYCVEKDIRAYVIPRIGDVLMSGAKRMHMFHLPILRVERYAPSPEYLFFKRFSDILLSLAALVLLSPVMLVTALAIRLTDGGPVFYRQCRLTKNGKKFNVLKFRSMRVDAERDGIARLSTGDKDPRITPVGSVIRKCRIDELPQLFNILGGSMSLVGPRPERPEIASQYEAQMPEFRLRLQAKAGLTGYAQVYGKYNTTPYDKLQMDLMYIANPGFKEDLRILLATVKVLFLPESTQGVAEGQVTANVHFDKSREIKSVDGHHQKV